MIVRSDSLNIPLRSESVHCVITSPPYWGLRDYGCNGQLGLEKTPEEYLAKMVEVFREVKRVLRDDGTLWLNLGDSYSSSATGSQGNGSSNLEGGKTTQIEAGKRPDKLCAGLKPKDLCGIPWRVAFALQADGWYLRSDIIWSKPNPMPESVTDRPTKAHEYVFLLSKSPKYYFDQEAVREPLLSSSISRLAQDVDSQTGSFRIPGKTNGPMKAVGHGFKGRQGGSERVGVLSGGEGSEEWTPNLSGRNIRTVWEIATQSFSGAHFATFPEELVRKCLFAGCPVGGVVFDPFIGSGTVGVVAQKYNRKWVGCELKPDYCRMAKKRTISTDVAMI